MLTLLIIFACGGEPSSAPSSPAGGQEHQRIPGHGPHPGGPPPGGEMAAVTTPPGEYEPVGGPSSDPRSILFISWDTVRADRLGLYGGRVPTPNLNALAASGGAWEQAITHFPETALSHWSMLTGVEPELHGNIPATGSSRYRGPTVAEIAGAHGYSTAAFIGGVTLTASASGLHRGFDKYDDRWEWQRTDLKRPGSNVVERARTWISQQTGDYFAFVHLFDAHHPYNPPAPYDTMFPAEGPRAPEVEEQLALYDGEIAKLDDLLGQLMSVVDEDTVVVLTSDHGESFEHGYLYNHRESLWDNTLNVPLVIRGAGIEAGSRFAGQVALTDIFPTVLQLAGLPPDAKSQGVSLLDGSERPLIYSSTDPWMPQRKLTLRGGGAKVIWHDSGDTISYDLQTDPGEESPLSSVPSHLGGGDERYEERIDAASGLQRAELPSRHVPQHRVEQLRALGYVGRHGEE